MKILSLINYASDEFLSTYKDADIVNIASFFDERFEQNFYKIEAGSEAYALALLCVLTNLANFDSGELSAESCLGEEEAEEILHFLAEAKKIILSHKLLLHKDKNLYFYALALAKKFDLELEIDTLPELKEPMPLDNFDGLILHSCLKENEFIASKSFANIAKITAGEKITIKTSTNHSLNVIVKIDENFRGIFALCKDFGEFAFCKVKEITREN